MYIGTHFDRLKMCISLCMQQPLFATTWCNDSGIWVSLGPRNTGDIWICSVPPCRPFGQARLVCSENIARGSIDRSYRICKANPLYLLGTAWHATRLLSVGIWAFSIEQSIILNSTRINPQIPFKHLLWHSPFAMLMHF